MGRVHPARPFDSFGQNGTQRVNLAKLAVKRGLKGGTLKQSLITYGHGITWPGVLYKPMVNIYPSSKGFSRYGRFKTVLNLIINHSV